MLQRGSRLLCMSLASVGQVTYVVEVACAAALLTSSRGKNVLANMSHATSYCTCFENSKFKFLKIWSINTNPYLPSVQSIILRSF
ncbi:hypothetical protein O6H91_08G023700 [Diphasiastrum complanatum]|uniref:Uncharacterized protein n=1 Tax=Diphasiastrum complanatum TaxID=34168 RepID=A0ACC2CVM6_DIPCM|nr:hypothetical protein O6H91_08G023700 [Diphasiastrum complanatum]